MAATDTAADLRRAAAGLTYQSETDAPWRAFHWAGAAGVPTGEAVRRRGRHAAGAPVAEQSLEEFFAPLVADQKWYGEPERETARRYRNLLDTLERLLRDPKVFRIGRRKLVVYVAGVAPGGGWAGLKTTAVET